MSQPQNTYYPLDQHRRRSCASSYILPDPHEQLDRLRRLNQAAEARGYQRTRTEAPPTQADASAAEPLANQDQDQEPTSSRPNTGYIDLTTSSTPPSSNSSSTEHEPTPPSTLAPARPEPTIHSYSQNPLLRTPEEQDREITNLKQQLQTDFLMLESTMKRIVCVLEVRNMALYQAARLDSGSRTAPTTTQMDSELDEMWICSLCRLAKDFDSHARCREIFAARLRNQRQRDRGGARRMDPNPNPSRNRSRSRSPVRHLTCAGNEEDQQKETEKENEKAKEKEKESEKENETVWGGTMDTDRATSLASIYWGMHNEHAGSGPPYFPC
ncbi:hypothetical protein BDV19DRAFT_389462 [Aspergillus venezuelensis]